MQNTTITAREARMLSNSQLIELRNRAYATNDTALLAIVRVELDRWQLSN